MSSKKPKTIFFSRLGIRWRLTILFSGILGTLLCLFGLMLTRFLHHELQSNFDSSLYNLSLDLSQSLDFDFWGTYLQTNNIENINEKIFPFSVGRALIQVRSNAGNVVVRSKQLGNLTLPLTNIDRAILEKEQPLFKTIQLSNISGQFRLLSTLVEHARSPKIILQVAVPLQSLEEEMGNIRTLLWVMVPFALIVSILLGYVLSRKAFSAVRAITREANLIKPDHLQARVGVPIAQDEIRHLALTLNDLLSRLEKAFLSQEQFIADASHQLKTPLAVIKAELDLLKNKSSVSQEELREALDSASSEMTHLAKTVENLLILTRMHSDEKTFLSKHIRFDEIVLESLSKLKLIAKKEDIKLKFNLEQLSQYEVQGDPILLEAMVHNLIDNAIKYSQPNGTVEIALKDAGDRIAVEVTNQGQTVKAENADKIFERFFRDPNHQARIKGTGLGLPIARMIAQTHGGSIVLLRSQKEGTTFRAEIQKHHPSDLTPLSPQMLSGPSSHL